MDNTTSKKSIGIITIATGRYYDEFIPALKKSVDAYLHQPNLDIHFYCFTDSSHQELGVHHFPIKHLAWPFSTLMRFHWIAKKMPVLEQNDFLLYMDADMKLVSPIPAEIFNHPLIAVQHPGFIEGSAPFELDRTESAYVAPPLRKQQHTNAPRRCEQRRAQRKRAGGPCPKARRGCAAWSRSCQTSR